MNKTNIELARKPVDLAPGTYRGSWRNEIITLTNGVQIETVYGCRALGGAPCTVVANGLITATLD